MYNQNNMIKIERFIEIKYLKKDFIIVFSYITLFLIFGFIEKNLFLPDDGLGLLEHITIWIFLVINLIIPFFININFRILEKNINQGTFDKLKIFFIENTKYKSIIVLLNFTITIGFCCFVGNSLQNAHIINTLPFDYWDSINYIMCFVMSRLYKFYLFVYFIPVTLVYVFVLIKSISNLLVITEDEMAEYPIKNYMQLNILCDFGLNTLLTILIPIILFSCSVYLVHNRIDITTITTMIVAVVSALVFFIMYILLIKKFYLSVIKYKKKHIEEIDLQLSKIHQAIVKSSFNKKNSNELDSYLKKEKYLWDCRERINKISKYPLIIKAIFTILSPLIPTFLKIFLSFFKDFF